MRVAVCVSGVVRGEVKRNNERLKEKFPGADFYYATWDGSFPDCKTFPEPKPHYHPYVDIDPKHYTCPIYRDAVAWAKKGGKERLNWTSHHVKQILIHFWLADTIKDNYEIVIRTRFDAYISRKADFNPYILDTYTNNRANCFGTTRPEGFDSLFEVELKGIHTNWMLDSLFIHNACLIDRAKVDDLYDNKKRHAAEFGWHQVLGKHRNHSGWVNPDHSVLPKFL
jgi:hypothetical protein